MDEYTQHMHKDIIHWNIQMCEEEISKYNKFNEFYKNSHKCYDYIQKNNLYYSLEKINYVKFKKKILKRTTFFNIYFCIVNYDTHFGSC